jgi:hypothetical protein
MVKMRTQTAGSRFKINLKIKTGKSTRAKHKTLVIGESHARGIAPEIQHDLGADFEIQGIVKPGSDLAVITHRANRDTSTLTNRDAVIVWGGTRDISRNDNQNCFRQIRNFVKRHSETNVLVVNVPNSFDLETHSCVNYELKTFNRKLNTHMKTFRNATTVDRDNFTQHGLHLIRQGKEQAAKQLQAL